MYRNTSGYIGVYRGNGKENGNYHLGFGGLEFKLYVGSCPHPLTVDDSGIINGLQKHYKNYAAVNEWGQHPDYGARML